jgi:hypothetical protein
VTRETRFSFASRMLDRIGERGRPAGCKQLLRVPGYFGPASRPAGRARGVRIPPWFAFFERLSSTTMERAPALFGQQTWRE